MKAWRNKVSGYLHDIQLSPNPLPMEYNLEEWELVNVTENDLEKLRQRIQYQHTRGLQGLFEDIPTTNTLNLGELL